MLRSTITPDEWLDQWYRKGDSLHTLHQAKYSRRAYLKFLKEKLKEDESIILEQLRKGNSKQICIFIQDFINFEADRKLDRSTIEKYLMYLKDWFWCQDIKPDPRDMKHFVHLPKKIIRKKIPMTQEIARKLMDVGTPKQQAVFILALKSSMRIGEVLSRKKKHFLIDKDPVMVTIEGESTKGNMDRETYIDPEAWHYIKPIWEKTKSDDDYLFVKKFHPMYSVTNWDKEFGRMREKAGIVGRWDNGRFHMHTHKTRKYFHTRAVETHNVEYAHAIDGHRGDALETYYETDEKKRGQMYKELVPSLAIYDDFKAKNEVKTLTEKLKKQDIIEDDIKKLQAQLTRLSMKN